MAQLGTSISVTTVGPSGTPNIAFSNLFAAGQTPWGVPNVSTLCTSFADFIRQFGGVNQMLTSNIASGTSSDTWTKETSDPVLQCYYSVKAYFDEKGSNSPGVLYFCRVIGAFNPPIAVSKTFTDGSSNLTTIKSRWPGVPGATTQVTITNPSPRKGAGYCYFKIYFPQANITEEVDIATAADAANFSKKSQLVTITLPAGGQLPQTLATAKLYNVAGGTAPFNDLYAAIDTDFIGTISAAGVKTGLQVFTDDKLGAGFVAVPKGYADGYNTSVRSGINTLCANYGPRMGLIGSAAGLNQSTVVTDISGLNGNDLAYIWPRVWVTDQSSDQGGQILVDPVGAWAGLHARMDRDYRQPHKSAAGITHPFLSLIDVERASNGAELCDDGGSNTLADSFVNTIRVKGNPAGIVVWGLRTLASDNRFRQIPARRVTQLVIWGAKLILEKFSYEPIDSKGVLFTRVKADMDAFLGRLLADGALYGSAPGKEPKSDNAYFIFCDRGNNPDVEVGQGRLHVDVAFVPTLNAEQIICNLLVSGPGNVKLI